MNINFLGLIIYYLATNLCTYSGEQEVLTPHFRANHTAAYSAGYIKIKAILLVEQTGLGRRCGYL
jgi:hypothetical protein